MRPIPRPALSLLPLLVFAAVVAAPALHAQSGRNRLPPSRDRLPATRDRIPVTRDRLPPKQGTVGVAPAPSGSDTTPERPGRGERPDHPDRDRDRDRDGHRGRGHGGWYGGYGWGVGYGSHWIRRVGLEAILQSPQAQRMRFALNDRAYAAVFELQPGRGVRVVFPDDWAPERMLAAGWHEPPLPVNGDALAGMAGRPSGDVRWLYLVASDAPLGLVPQRRGVQALQALLGPMTFQSSSTFDVTQALRQRVLTLGAPGTWTDAIIAYRPGVDGAAAGGASVRCPNGVTYTLRAGESFECPR